MQPPCLLNIFTDVLEYSDILEPLQQADPPTDRARTRQALGKLNYIDINGHIPLELVTLLACAAARDEFVERALDRILMRVINADLHADRPSSLLYFQDGCQRKRPGWTSVLARAHRYFKSLEEEPDAEYCNEDGVPGDTEEE
ncbi:hypothetical protein SCAR479_04093 [Seiridium cardinale]|uniref:Uncharacterized protein n=1 Tax=Seiridium cardinale TaxID=138064 RepID=A0ABR2XYL6_9PEZI